MSSSVSMATLSHTQWWFARSKSAVTTKRRFDFRVSLSKDTRKWQEGPRAYRPLCQSVWSAAVYWLFAANLYMCIHMHTHVHIYAYTYIQIHRPSGYPPPADAPQCWCQPPAQTLKLRNRKYRLNLRIFQQPGYQDQVVTNQIKIWSEPNQYQKFTYCAGLVDLNYIKLQLTHPNVRC